jgi:hypothetical protein
MHFHFIIISKLRLIQDIIKYSFDKCMPNLNIISTLYYEKEQKIFQKYFTIYTIIIIFIH